MIRERMEALCAQVIDTLRGSAMREAMTGEMEARLAALALERASALRANLTR